MYLLYCESYLFVVFLVFVWEAVKSFWMKKWIWRKIQHVRWIPVHHYVIQDEYFQERLSNLVAIFGRLFNDRYIKITYSWIYLVEVLSMEDSVTLLLIMQQLRMFVVPLVLQLKPMCWNSNHIWTPLVTAAQKVFHIIMMTSSNGYIFHVTGHLCGEFTGLRWIPRTKASDAELWCYLWYAPE